MTDSSSLDPSEPPADSRLTLDALFDELADQPVPQRRHLQGPYLELLQRWLGDDLCRRLGIFALPDGFVLSVVVPVFNEVDTVSQVVDRLKAVGLPLEIVLVDDGSTDGTRQRLEELAAQPQLQVVYHESNQGKGAAITTGLARATGDVVVIQDADKEYDPLDFWVMLPPLLYDQADVVYGSRYAQSDRPVSPLWHRWANQFITFCTSLALGRKFTDVETCYKMFRREVIAPIVPTLREKRFGIEIELTFKICRQTDTRIHEVPIRYDRRTYAEGKKIGWRDGVSAMWCIFRFWLGRR